MKSETLDLGTLRVPYAVIKGRANRIKLSFRNDVLVVTTGSGELQAGDMAFVQVKKAWITRYYKYATRLIEAGEALRAALTTEALYLGARYPLTFGVGVTDDARLENGKIIITVGRTWRNLERKAQAKNALHLLAKRYLSERLHKWAQAMNLSYNRLTLKDHKSRWGSCSVKKNINLNWKLIMLEPRLIDYVLIHELAHLVELNHSPRFWALVEKYYPDYKSTINIMKEKVWLIEIYD